jgi:hypothetical protein
MMPRQSSRRAVASGILVALLASTAIAVAAVGGAGTPDTQRTRPASTIESVDTRQVETANRSTVDQSVVDSDQRLDAHQRMLEQMRVSVTPQMVQIMNADPLVDSPAELQELERYESDIDRMLARTP